MVFTFSPLVWSSLFHVSCRGWHSAVCNSHSEPGMEIIASPPEGI